MSDGQNAERASAGVKPMRLRDALRQARMDAAGRTGVVVDLRDAEMARLEILNEALDSLFADIPKDIDLFDRGISQGDPPRLWVDIIAHIQMGRDKRLYRFVQDTRYGRKVLAESTDTAAMANAVADYIARRMIEREQALSALPARADTPTPRRASRAWSFALGVLVGALALFAAAFYTSLK